MSRLIYLGLLAFFMSFENTLVFPDDGNFLMPPFAMTSGVEAAAKTAAPLPAPVAPAPAPAQENKPPPGKVEETTKVPVDSAPHEMPQARERKDHKDKPPAPLRFRDYMVVFGFLQSGSSLVLPRQVVPFSHNWKLNTGAEIEFNRYQLHFRTKERVRSKVADDMVQPDDTWDHFMVSDDGSRNWSQATSPQSYLIRAFPNGCAGFLGQQVLRCGLTMDQANAAIKLLGDAESKADMTEPKLDSVDRLAADVFPRFYRELNADELAAQLQILDAGSSSSRLRQMYDLTTQKWIWLYELGCDAVAPVFSADPEFVASSGIAAGLNARFGALYGDRRIFIGGNGVRLPIQINMETPRLTHSEVGMLSQTLSVNLFRRTDVGSTLRLNSVRLSMRSKMRKPSKTENPQPEVDSKESNNLINMLALQTVNRIWATRK